MLFWCLFSEAKIISSNSKDFESSETLIDFNSE